LSASRSSPLWALVPVKRFAAGKSRLADVLPPPERADFARSLLAHLLDELARAPSLAGAIVITDDPEAAAVARARSVEAWPDGAEPPLRHIVDAALLGLMQGKAAAALVLMSDLPRLAAADIAAIAALLDHHDIVVAPDKDEGGTNALALAPPTAMPTCFGHPDSFRRHCDRARDHGLRCAIYRNDRVSFDVDGPEDLATLRVSSPSPFGRGSG
jgi:2-phospho-L-lactate/phosphoenolpyruvate guanylyltransferase